MAKFWVDAIWDAHRKCLVSAYDGLMTFPFTAVFSLPSNLFSNRLWGLDQKVQACPLCFVCKYNSDLWLLKLFWGLYSFPFQLCRGGKKGILLPLDCSYFTLSRSSHFQQHHVVVTALSLIYLSPAQLQPVCYSVGIQAQVLIPHRDYFGNF